MADYNPSTDTVESLSSLANANFLAVNPNNAGDAQFAVYSGSTVATTILGSGNAATLSGVTIDTTNANIQIAELGTNAGLEMQGKTGKAAYIDLKHDGSPTFTGRWITESATAVTLWGGSGVTFNARAPFQVLNSVLACTTATGTVSVIRFASGSSADFGSNTICWDLAKTAGEDLALYRYNSGVPTEIFNVVRTTGLMTFASSVTFNAAVRLPTTSISAAGQLRRNADRLEFGNSAGTAVTLLDSASAISASASTMPNLQMIGSTRSFEVLAAGNNIRTEIRNAVSGGLIIRDQTLDAVASGADFHIREILNSATDYQVLGGAGLTYRFSLPVSFETTLAVPTTTIAAAGQLRRNGDNLEFGNSSGTAVTLLNSAGNLSNVADPITARSNLRLGVNAQSLSGPLTLTSSSATHQLLNPNGANRNVDLPTGAAGLYYQIENTAASSTTFGLVVRNAGGSTLFTILPQTRAGFFWNGSSWEVQTTVESNPTGVTGANAITNIVYLTESAYNSAGSYNPSTLYVIT